jgi:NADH-quinone oxidoreductase subunit L
VNGILGAVLPLVPFVCALVGLLLPRSSHRGAALLGITGAAVALLIALILAISVDGLVQTSHSVANFGGADQRGIGGGLAVTFGVRVDPAAAYVAVAVGLVALAVQVYSTAYLHDDDRYGPYAAQVSLFTAAMLVVVVSGDLVLLLIGWEVMGICSYLLIGHDRRLPEAPAAAVKAFLVTRVGDVGFLLGIAILGVKAGSFRIADVLAPGVLDPTTTTVVCLLLLAGVAGKSAQFPLHTWLPDAMAGPTPISALIHAATMVAAGVYVVTRLYPLFVASPTALTVLALMAAVTMLLGALAATAQDDLKRVLAWSTVSQIAYMTGALAIGAPAAALFHLLTHAAFKALLFLAAGSVIHATGTNLMSRMGGLRRGMPVTFWCTTIGLGALIGLPPLAGFWSKDEILRVAIDGTGWRYVIVYGAGLVTVFLTAAYATRLWLRVFFGEPREAVGTAHDSASGSPGSGSATPGSQETPVRAGYGHEPPRAMAWPVLVLAVPSALLGFAALSPAFARSLGAPDGFALGLDAMLPLMWAGLATAGVWWLWRQRPAEDPARVLGALRPLFSNAFYVDTIQNTLVVRPVGALARSVRTLDESGVDGVVEATGRITVRLGGLVTSVHRGSVPRAAAAVVAGAALLGLVAVTIAGVWP